MQEELNFGALTDYEMEKFLLLLQTDEQSLLVVHISINSTSLCFEFQSKSMFNFIRNRIDECMNMF